MLINDGDMQQQTNTAKPVFSIERRKVNVEYLGDGNAFVSRGLAEGEKVIDKGAHKVAAGQVVTLHAHSTVADNR